MIAMRAGDMTPAVRRQVLQMLDILEQTTAGGEEGKEIQDGPAHG
jgi:hypothetical protein